MKPLGLHFVSLFPQTIQVWFETGILGKARTKGLFTLETYQLRDFATDKHHTVDDISYGGGGGMVLKIEPLVKALEHIRSKNPGTRFSVLCPSPAGRPLNQTLVGEVNERQTDLLFVCGRYEGIDQRFIDHFVDLEFSLGDFVVTAGELPAIAFADATVRHIEGTLGNPDGPKIESFLLRDESFAPALLEYPQYTRPASFRGMNVPKELLSGDHSTIEQWRLSQAREKTRRIRPDLLKWRED